MSATVYVIAVATIGVVNTTFKVLLLEITPLRDAVMVVLPNARLVAIPLVFSVATVVLLDVQVSVPRVAGVPSDKIPLAVNCCVFPIVTLADEGVMVRVVNTGAVTVKVALLELTPFAEAVTVVLPCARLVAMPLAFNVATVVLLDAQVTDPETLPVLPSE